MVINDSIARRFVYFTLVFAGLVWAAGSNRALAGTLAFQGGATQTNQIKVFLVYWLPSGVVLDPTVSDGIGNFETLTESFIANVAGSSYLNVNTQYPGNCGLNQCVLANGPSAVVHGGSWVDTSPYPHAGSKKDPLQDANIQAEVTRAISVNDWKVDANSQVIVMTGVESRSGSEIEECDGNLGCSYDTFCAYHNSFPSNGSIIAYSYLSDASFNTAGCDEGISTGPNGQASSDREVALMSHEFAETITDPVYGAGWLDSSGNEIGDNCNQIPAAVWLGSGQYVVQKLWSNTSARCVSAFGPSIQFKITGGDGITDDGGGLDLYSSLSAALLYDDGKRFEKITLKAAGQSDWINNSRHIVVAGFDESSATPLSSVQLTMVPTADDPWPIASMTVTVLDGSGVAACQQTYSGYPAAQFGTVLTHDFGITNCVKSVTNVNGRVVGHPTTAAGAKSIAVGPNAEGSIIGDGWILGEHADSNGDYDIYRWVNSAWVKQSGAATQIAIGPGGAPWVVNHAGQIYYWNGSGFAQIQGCATSISVGPNEYGSTNGDPWIIGCGATSDRDIYQLQFGKWLQQPGSAARIAVEPLYGTAWVLDHAGEIFHWDGAGFAKNEGCATDIAIGPPTTEYSTALGDAWILGCGGTGNQNVYHLEKNKWVQIPGSGVKIAVSPDLGIPWVVDAAGDIAI